MDTTKMTKDEQRDAIRVLIKHVLAESMRIEAPVFMFLCGQGENENEGTILTAHKGFADPDELHMTVSTALRNLIIRDTLEAERSDSAIRGIPADRSGTAH